MFKDCVIFMDFQYRKKEFEVVLTKGGLYLVRFFILI